MLIHPDHDYIDGSSPSDEVSQSSQGSQETHTAQILLETIIQMDKFGNIQETVQQSFICSLGFTH